MASERNTAAVVAQLVARYGWCLIAADELVARADALSASQRVFDEAHAVFAIYTPLLFRACCGQDGAERQAQAYAEIWRYLRQAVVRVAPDLSLADREEIVSETLALLYERICNPQREDRLHTPHALLAAALQQLRNGVRSWRRTLLLPWVEPLVAYDADPGDTLAYRELEARVRACFVECLRRYPRARLQIYAVWLRHIEQLDNEAVMQRLALSSTHSRSLYSRGLRRLREDPAWQALGREWGFGNAQQGAAYE